MHFFDRLHIDSLKLDFGLLPGAGPGISRSLPWYVAEVSPDWNKCRRGGGEAAEAGDRGRRSAEAQHLD